MASPPLNSSNPSPYFDYSLQEAQVPEEDILQEPPTGDLDPENRFEHVTIRGIIRATGDLSLIETPISEEVSPTDRTDSCQRILKLLNLTPAEGTASPLDIEDSPTQPATPLSAKLTLEGESLSSPSEFERSFEGFTTPISYHPRQDQIIERQLEIFSTILTSFMQSDDETLLQLDPIDRKELQKWIDLFLANFNSSTIHRRDYEALATLIQERLQQPAFENYFQF